MQEEKLEVMQNAVSWFEISEDKTPRARLYYGEWWLPWSLGEGQVFQVENPVLNLPAFLGSLAAETAALLRWLCSLIQDEVSSSAIALGHPA